MNIIKFIKSVNKLTKVIMRILLRHVLSILLIVAASSVSAGVITQDGVVFTSRFTGNVLTLEIDAARRIGGWAGAMAIDALAIKTVGSFEDVKMSSSTGASWALSSAELNASGCAAKGKGKSEGTRLCYGGNAVPLADNMLFTFVVEGNPVLSAPHLKVHFVNASGAKVGSLLSMDFPWQAEVKPMPAPAPAPAPTPVPTPAPAPVEPALIPPPGTSTPGGKASEHANTPIAVPVENQSGDVPEPQSFAIVGAGLAVMGLARRRRKGNGKRRVPLRDAPF